MAADDYIQAFVWGVLVDIIGKYVLYSPHPERLYWPQTEFFCQVASTPLT